MSSGAASLAERRGGGPAGGCAIAKEATRIAAMPSFRFMVASLLFHAQALVDGIDELVGRPEAAGFVVNSVVVERRLRGLHLFERETFLDAVGDAVANDGGHVAIFD